MRILDIGCPDFAAASRNREMVENHENAAGYQLVEAVLRGWPSRKPLPNWIPQGKLPTIGKHEAREIEAYGMHELEE